MAALLPVGRLRRRLTGYAARRDDAGVQVRGDPREARRHRPRRGEPGLLGDPRAQGRALVRDRRDQEPRDLLREPRRRRRRPGRPDRRPDQARLRLRGRVARRPQGERHGRARLGLDGVRLGRGPALQLRRRRAEHVPDLERDTARRARRLRARVLPRLPDRPGLVHRRVLRQPRLVDDQRLGVEVSDPAVSDMGVRLRPLREDELDDWVSRSREGYAREMVEHGGFPELEAREKAHDDFATHLDAARRGVFVLEDDSSGALVGHLWLIERRGALAVLDVYVDEGLRGRGYGRAAMLLAEDEARRRGFERINLNVFAGNAIARSLYTSLGYEERSVYMSKSLS